MASNRLLIKLLKQQGGWSNLLYTTLKDVCEVVDDETVSVMGTGEVIADAEEIIKAYEELQLGQEDDELPVPKVRRIPSAHKAAAASTSQVSPVKESVPKVKALLAPQSRRTILDIDDILGSCQGDLPIAGGWRLVNLDKVRITTKTGIFLGMCNGDGQVLQSEHVSGFVSASGKIRFVFKDVTLGEARLDYWVQPKPPGREPMYKPAPAVPEGEKAGPRPVTPEMVASREASKAAHAKVAEIASQAGMGLSE